MTDPSSVPNTWRGPFRVDAALANGLSRSRLTRRDLMAPLHGVRAPAAYEVDIIEAVALVLRRDQYVSHVTAARLWGAPLPSRLQDALVHVTSIGPAPIMRRPQVTPHRIRVGDPDVRTLHGIPVSGPARCWFECASILTVEELVVLGDFFVGPSALATIDDLAAAITRNARAAVTARAALGRVRAGAESPMETRMRLSVVDAGFPEPEVNVDVFDDDGQFLGRVDLAWPESRIALEYDGEHHRGREQYRRDQRRANGFSVNRWIVIHATAMDADRPSVLFERLRQAFVQRRLEQRRAA
ncbi:hypothetical protein [Curtobacterium sp. 9128]|uniref:hypothetical protein n=1 Tax=Curtobacterium sp. 9128 TaxID=1793722 RepID=UPI0011A3A2FC|nr:hypothetical protein [Curtobacterium sp. 9128]